MKREIELKEQKLQEEKAEFQKEVENIQAQKARELKIVERNFDRQSQELRNQSQRRVQATQQELCVYIEQRRN